MKESIIIFFMLFFILPAQNLRAQTLNQLIDLNFDAVKQDKYNKLTTIVTNSAVRIGNQNGTLVVIHKRNDKMRKELKIGKKTTVTAYDGIHAWRQINKEKPEIITGQELDDLKFQADMDGYFFCWREKSHNLTLEGKDNLHGQQVFKIKCVKENGDNAELFLDAKSYLLIRTIQKMTHGEKTVTTETDISNYKKVDGIPFPHKFEIKRDKTIEVKKVRSIKLNMEIPDSIFTMPKSAETK